jgi:hypothetical protein
LRLNYSIRFILVTTFVSAAAIQIFQNTIGRDPLIRTDRSKWYDDGIGIVERVHTGAWESHDVTTGPGSYLKLDQGTFDTNTFDGGSLFEASFQMPRNIKVGDTFEFKPIPTDRPTVTLPSTTNVTYTMMLPGEFTAFQFGNPIMDWMPSDSESNARLEVLSMTDDAVRFQLKLHATLPNFSDIDLNEEFHVSRVATKSK